MSDVSVHVEVDVDARDGGRSAEGGRRVRRGGLHEDARRLALTATPAKMNTAMGRPMSRSTSPSP
jgi:hypothetical protein